MTNYKQFYNAWQDLVKPKRKLLIEELEQTKAQFEQKLEQIKNLMSGQEFVNKYYPSYSRPGEFNIDPLTAEARITTKLEQFFSQHFKEYEIALNPKDYDYIIGDKNSKLVSGASLQKMREKYAAFVNQHFKVFNDKGEQFIFANLKFKSGIQNLILRKPGFENKEKETPEEIHEKDKLTVKST